MISRHILPVVLLLAATRISAQLPPDILWQRCLGGSDEDFFYSMAVLPDGRCVITSILHSTDGDITTTHGVVDAWVVLVDQEGQLVWQKAMGGSSSTDYLGASVTQTGNILLCGVTGSLDGDVVGNHGSQDGWIMEMDDTGTLLWQRCLGGSGYDRMDSYPLHLADGGYLLSGNSLSADGDVPQNQGESDVWLVRLDATGGIVWSRTFGGSGVDHPYALEGAAVMDADGAFTVVGVTQSTDGDITGYQGGLWDIWVVKVDGEGELLWQRALGGTGDDRSAGITATADGGSVIWGYTNSTDGDAVGQHGELDCWVVKLDADGGIVWQRMLGGSSDDAPASVQETPEGDLLLVGSVRSNNGDVSGNHGGKDGWVVKLYADGELLWERACGGSTEDGLYNLLPIAGGGMLVVGDALSNNGDVSGNHGLYDAWITELDTDGELVEQRAMGGSNYDYFKQISPSGDGGYFVCGAAASEDGSVVGHHGDNHYDIWLMKLGDLHTEIGSVAAPSSGLRVFPDPSDGEVEVILPAGTTGKLEIIDPQGRVVLRQADQKDRCTLDLRALPAGAYSIQLLTPQGRWYQRVVLY